MIIREKTVLLVSFLYQILKNLKLLNHIVTNCNKCEFEPDDKPKLSEHMRTIHGAEAILRKTILVLIGISQGI